MVKADFNKLIAQLEDVKESIEELRDKLVGTEEADQLADAETTIEHVADDLEELEDESGKR